jgi:hypothetical protein
MKGAEWCGSLPRSGGLLEKRNIARLQAFKLHRAKSRHGAGWSVQWLKTLHSAPVVGQDQRTLTVSRYLFWPNWESVRGQGKDSGDRPWRSTIVARADFLMKPVMASAAGAPILSDGNQTRSEYLSVPASFDAATIGARISGTHGLSAIKCWTL